LPLKLKVAVPPERVAVPTTVPFASKVTCDRPAVFPVPETDSVNPVRVTVEGLEFVSTTCSTATLEAPGNWLELAGGLGPCETVTVTDVGVPVAVTVGLAVAVLVVVKVLVKVAVRVGVEEGVAVLISVLVAV